jgi:WD40 repeat protein
MGSLKQTLKGHSSWVFAVAFSPDSRLLASDSDKIIRLWDTATGGLQRTLEGHSSSIISVVFSPNGQLLASGSHDGIIRLWDTITGGLRQILAGHLSWVKSLAFSPDSQLLASGSNDNTVRLWDNTTGVQREVIRTQGMVTQLELFQNGSRIITNLGSIHIQPTSDSDISGSHRHPDIFLEQHHWISLNRDRVLWLPPEARPTCSAIKRNIIAMGHASGRISFLGFQV